MDAAVPKLDPATLEPAHRTAFEALHAEVAALTERNRRLEDHSSDLQARNGRLEGLNSHLQEQNRRLEHLLRELRRAMFGKKSEKLHPDQLRLALEELEGALAEAEEAAPGSTAPTARPRRPAPERNLGHLPEHLPRIERVIEPESTYCPCGCGEMVRIGEDRTERLDIVPAQLRVIVTVRAEVRLPGVRARRHPGPGARAPHRGRASERGRDRACPRLQVRRPLSAASPGADLRPLGDRS